MLDLGGSVSDTVKVEGGWRTFFHVNANPRTGHVMHICSAFTRDGRTWQVEAGDRGQRTRSGTRTARRGRSGAAPTTRRHLADGHQVVYGERAGFRAARGQRAAIRQCPPRHFDPLRRRLNITRKSIPTPSSPPLRGGVSAPGGPAPMRLMIASSPDGLAFERRNLIVTDQGAVPDLVVDEQGWIWLYYQAASVGDAMNRVALALSKDDGASWTFRHVSLAGFSAPKARSVRPGNPVALRWHVPPLPDLAPNRDNGKRPLT